MRYTFRALIHDISEKYADEVLLYNTADSRSLSYADCLTLTDFVSKRLASAGFKRGDIIVNYCPLSLESVILCWACLYNGLIFLPVDHNWPGTLLKQVLDEASPSMMITDNEGMATTAPIFPKEKTVLSGEPDLAEGVSFYDWLESGDMDAATDLPESYPDDPAIILYTSGSTGIPKGVVLSQHALCNSGKLVGEHFGWERGDSFMNLGDLHSMSGFRNTCIAPLHSGCSMVIASSEERNVILYVLELIQNLNVQFIGVAPTVIRQMNLLFNQLRKEQLSSLKAILCTAGPLAKDQLKEFYEKYNVPVYNYYGLTETAGLCSGHNASTFSCEDNSIGIPAGAEFILLPEPGYDDPSIGALVVKSDNIMQGYYKREVETAAVLIDGGFYTGDIVQRRADGCYELLGRKKNFIKTIHAELIHLEEIDMALEASPGIKEACACSYIHQEEDERIIAFIVAEEYPTNAESQFIDTVKESMFLKVGKNRAPWCYIFHEKLPRNTLGKIERQKLTEKLYELLQSEHPRYF